MLHYKKIAVVAGLFALMATGMSAIRPQDDDKPKKRNLKVLPKDISHDDLDKVMDGWKAALGVKCNFCHAPSADSSNHHLDFASDAKPTKAMARRMMTMTQDIATNFGAGNVTCYTCHRGDLKPKTTQPSFPDLKYNY